MRANTTKLRAQAEASLVQAQTGGNGTIMVKAADVIELLDEVEKLRTRQQELLATIVRVTNETPFADEAADALKQRGSLVAEIGTLRAKLAAALEANEELAGKPKP